MERTMTMAEANNPLARRQTALGETWNISLPYPDWLIKLMATAMAAKPKQDIPPPTQDIYLRQWAEMASRCGRMRFEKAVWTALGEIAFFPDPAEILERIPKAEQERTYVPPPKETAEEAIRRKQDHEKFLAMVRVKLSAMRVDGHRKTPEPDDSLGFWLECEGGSRWSVVWRDNGTPRRREASKYEISLWWAYQAIKTAHANCPNVTRMVADFCKKIKSEVAEDAKTDKTMGRQK